MSVCAQVKTEEAHVAEGEGRSETDASDENDDSWNELNGLEEATEVSVAFHPPFLLS